MKLITFIFKSVLLVLFKRLVLFLDCKRCVLYKYNFVLYIEFYIKRCTYFYVYGCTYTCLYNNAITAIWSKLNLSNSKIEIKPFIHVNGSECVYI